MDGQKLWLVRDRITVWNRYSRKLGDGSWDTDNAVTTHAELNGRTLCGRRTRTVQEGWEHNTHASRALQLTTVVDCRACVRVLEK